MKKGAPKSLEEIAAKLAAEHPEVMKTISDSSIYNAMPAAALKAALGQSEELRRLQEIVGGALPAPIASLATAIPPAALKPAPGFVPPRKPPFSFVPPPRRAGVAPPQPAPVRATPATAAVPAVAAWLRARRDERGPETKKALGSAARQAFPKLRDAVFNAAFKEVYGYERGRPRLPNNR